MSTADKTLDCVGLYCPMPIVKTAQKIKIRVETIYRKIKRLGLKE